MTYLYKILSIILLVLSIMFVMNYEIQIPSEVQITGNVVNDAYGCCETTCTQTNGIECSGDSFHPEKECKDLSQCNVGCCIDAEQNCYTNYLENLCDKEGDIFVGGRECQDFKQCLIAPPAPARQTGFMFQNNDGVLLVEKHPNSGQIGTPFTFEITTAEKEKFVQLEINASGNIFTKTAYDDGLGTDKKANDEKYTASWIASFPTDEKGIIPVSLQVLIDGEKRGKTYPLFISPTSCVYSTERFPLENITRKNIIFAKNDRGGESAKDSGIETLSKMIDTNFDFFFTYNLYHVEDVVNSLSEIKQECFFVENPDLIVLIDENEKLCTQKGNYVTLNPNFGMNPREDRPENGSFIDDFCKYVTTKEHEIKLVKKNFDVPSIRLTNPKENDKISTKEMTVTFSAHDNQSDILRYGIYQDSDYNKIAWGYMKSGSTITRKVKTQDGKHKIYVNVEDTNRNIVGKGVNVTVDYSNFIVTTDLITDTTVDRYLSFSFSYTHDKFTNSTYHIFDGKRSIQTGTALRNEENYVTLDLKTGEHTIYVVLYDNEGRKASSYEYIINSRRTTSLITANAIVGVERFSPTTSKPFDNASEDGYKVKEKTDDQYDYKEVDEEGKYEPKKLCEVSLGGSEDTLVRYRPANCMNKTGSEIDIEPVSRDFINDQYFYEYSYFVKSCDDEIFFDAYLKDDFDNQEGIYSGVLDTGYGADDRGSQSSFSNYTMVCLTVSDPNATIAGFYGAPSVFVAPEFSGSGNATSINNDTNSSNQTYSTEAEFIPLESQYHTPVVINDELGTTVCVKFSLKQCENGIDDDGDGVIDMEDPGCNSSFDDNEGDGTTECQDGEDNDGDTQIDEDDIACWDESGKYNKSHNNEASRDAQCSDKKDNDGDGMCDFDGCIIEGEERPADPGCENGSDDRESDATSECQDGIDNDGNGFCDFGGCRVLGRDLPRDYGCKDKFDLFEHEEPPECLDGIDNDGNGWIDMEDWGCNSTFDDIEQLSGEVCDSFDETKFRGKFSYDLVNGTRSYTYDYEIHACYWNLVYGIYLKQGDKTLELNTSTNGVLLKNDFEKYKNTIYNDDIYTEFCVEVFIGNPQFGKKCFKIEQNSE